MKPAVIVCSVIALAGLIFWQIPKHGSGPAGSAATDHTGQDRGGTSTATPPPKAATRGHERPEGTAATFRNLLSHTASLYDEGNFDAEALKRLRAKLDALEPDELLEVLRELDASDAKPQAKRQLASLIASSLARRDPGLAMETFTGRIAENDTGLMHQMEIIYQMWLGRDATAATAWLDRQPEGSSPLLPSLSRALIRSLAARDPEAATARFAALNEPARNATLLGDWFPALKNDQAKNVADFLRRQWDDPSVLAHAAALRLRQGGLSDAAAFIDAISPSPAERSALAAETLRGKITQGDELLITPREARDWIMEQAPHDAASLTGVALGQFVGWYDFSEMSRLALGYRDESGSDEVLAAFLKTAPANHRTAILELAEQLSNPAARQEIEERFSDSP